MRFQSLVGLLIELTSKQERIP